MAISLVRNVQTSAGLTTATTAYSAGDQVGTIFTFPGFAAVSGGGGLLTGITLYDESDIIGTYTVSVYSATVTLVSDNAAAGSGATAPSDSDGQLLIAAPITLGPVVDVGVNRVTSWAGLIPYVCGATSLFASLKTEGAHTFFGATTSLKLALSALLVS